MALKSYIIFMDFFVKIPHRLRISNENAVVVISLVCGTRTRTPSDAHTQKGAMLCEL